MSSRKEVIKAIAIVEKKLLTQQACVDEHLRFWAAYIQYYKPLLIAASLPFIVFSLRKINKAIIRRFGTTFLALLFLKVRYTLQTFLWTLMKRIL